MSSTLVAEDASAVKIGRPPVPRTASAGWLFGPTADLVLLANLYWPLIAVAAWAGGAMLGPLSFLQLYFISSAHRWITLPLVFLDRERMATDGKRFAVVGGLLLAGGGLLVLIAAAGYRPEPANANIAGSLVLLMMVDFIWNAWHFASQHAGIGRIYARTAKVTQSAGSVEFEKAAIRLLVLWTLFRVASVLAAPVAGFGEWLNFLAWLDPVLAAPAAVAAGRAVVGISSGGLGRFAYLASVVTLYTATLTALALHNYDLVRGLFLCGALYHATEYLMVCWWTVRRRRTGVWQHESARGIPALVGFVVVIGVANWLLFIWSPYGWALVTLLVSLLHYGYDGMIWKRRPTPSSS